MAVGSIAVSPDAYLPVVGVVVELVVDMEPRRQTNAKNLPQIDNAIKPRGQLPAYQRGRDLRAFRLQGCDQRLQERRIIRKDPGHSRHASDDHKAARVSMKTRCFTEMDQPTRAGGAPRSGRRQSMPSQSIANCAEVKRAAPSPRAGQGKRPFSSTL